MFFHQLFGVLQKFRFIIFWQFKVVSRVVRHEVGCVSEGFLLPLVTCVFKTMKYILKPFHEAFKAK